MLISICIFATLISWVLLTLISSIPFYLGTTNLNFIDSFESMSGLTTTGATVINDLDNTSKSILIWRAMIQWLGGIGIIVIAIALLILKIGGMQLFQSEFSSKEEKVLPRTKTIAAGIGALYFIDILCSLSLFLYNDFV